MPVLAGEAPAIVPDDVGGSAGLSSLGGQHASAFFANLGHQTHLVHQPDGEYHGSGRVGVFMVPIPVEHTWASSEEGIS